MQELLFWLIILPVMSFIAVLVLFREQLFTDPFKRLLSVFVCFYLEMCAVYEYWPSWFIEELAHELEQKEQVQLAYTPLLLDEPVSEKEEESACIKLSSK